MVEIYYQEEGGKKTPINLNVTMEDKMITEKQLNCTSRYNIIMEVAHPDGNKWESDPVPIIVGGK